MVGNNRKGKNVCQSYDEIVEQQTELREKQENVKAGRTPYNKLDDEYKPDPVSEIVTRCKDDLVHNTRIRLEDTEDVLSIMQTYLQACSATGTFPTNMGLARALGYSQRSLSSWRRDKSNHPTGELLEMFADACSDVLSQSALKGNANNVFSIFMLKAQHGWRDNLDITVAPEQPKPAVYDIEEIRSRYLPMDE